jgi:hypothetical protein
MIASAALVLNAINSSTQCSVKGGIIGSQGARSNAGGCWISVRVPSGCTEDGSRTAVPAGSRLLDPRRQQLGTLTASRDGTWIVADQLFRRFSLLLRLVAISGVVRFP